MGRVIMYTVIGLLGAFVLAATFLVESGDESRATVAETTVEQLMFSSDDFDGQEVSTRGILVFDEAAELYSVEEDSLRLRIKFDQNDISEFIGEEVYVVGQLDHDSDGVFIEADRVRPTDVTADSDED